MPKARTPEREQFLADVLLTAMYHQGHGFPEELDANYPDGKPGEWFAVISNRYTEEGEEDYGRTWRVDLDTMAKGLGVIRRWVYEDGKQPSRWVRDLLLADRTNGDDGDVDVVSALAVLECALFGDVVYG